MKRVGIQLTVYFKYNFPILLLFLLYIDADECSPNPCFNGGSCVDGVHIYTCSCVAGYTGANCEKNEYKANYQHILNAVLLIFLFSFLSRYRRMLLQPVFQWRIVY